MLRRLFLAFLFSILFVGIGRASTVAISASDIADSFGRPLASGKLCFTPVDATETPTGFRDGSVQVQPTEVCGLVSNGVLQSGLALEPTPTGFYYHIETETVNHQLIKDYGMTSITGTSWTLDTYDPSMAVIPVQAITVGTVTELPFGSSPTATITGSGPLLLNLGIPAGESGVGYHLKQITLSPSAPNSFTVAHGLNSPPVAMWINMTYPPGGMIWFQATAWDSTNVYLVASDSGVTGVLTIFY